MGKLIYLNPDLPVRLCTVPASAVVKLRFADDRENYLWPIKDYYTPRNPPVQADFPLETLNYDERLRLEVGLREVRPTVVHWLPWRPEKVPVISSK
jgi:hypothetical protein